jgi:hypothetical protein
MSVNKTYFKPPFIGLLAFVGVFIVQGLGHTTMALMHWLIPEYEMQFAFVMGLAGLGMLLHGMRVPGETAATWWGFFAAMLMWTGWVEYAFIKYSRLLDVAPLLYADGEIATKPEYLLMEASVGVMLVVLCYFLLNKETKCNFFHWIQRNLKLPVGKPNPSHERNFALITFVESIFLLWFFYLLLLVVYNEAWLGETHPGTYVIFVLNTIWTIYLFSRLVKMWKVGTAIRYAIATGIIAFTSYELLGRWGIGPDIWMEPQQYMLELGLITLAIVVITAVSWLTPDHIKAKIEREARAFEEEQSQRGEKRPI